MNGRDFAIFRKSIGHTLETLAPILGLNSKQALNYQEGLKDANIILEMFYNYAQRYGAEEAEIEFKRRFNAQG